MVLKGIINWSALSTLEEHDVFVNGEQFFVLHIYSVKVWSPSWKRGQSLCLEIATIVLFVSIPVTKKI